MTSEPRDTNSDDPACDLSLHEAAAIYAVSARTLAHHIRCGQLPAYKTAGATGREWRVTREALSAGYALRQRPEASDHPLVLQLRREVEAARRRAAAERRRAEDADRRLGHALLECGRLRSALAAATGADTPTEVDLTFAEAREVVRAVREAAPQRP